MLKVAVTLAFVDIETAQAPVPEQAPLQPEKTDPAAGVAVSVTVLPAANEALQLAPGQLMPAGEDATVPAPAPVRLVESV